MCETGGCNGGLECDPDTGTSTFDMDLSEEAHPSPESHLERSSPYVSAHFSQVLEFYLSL